MSRIFRFLLFEIEKNYFQLKSEPYPEKRKELLAIYKNIYIINNITR